LIDVAQVNQVEEELTKSGAGEAKMSQGVRKRRRKMPASARFVGLLRLNVEPETGFDFSADK
jgi:hypothetical protein